MPYVLEIKESAARRNAAVGEYVAEHDRRVRLDSRADAEALAERLSAAGEPPVRVQRAAPNDADDVSAYLVPAPDRRVREPAVTDDGTLVFDVGANLYGALGEALVVGTGDSPPLLTHYAARDLELPQEAIDVRVDADADAVTAPSGGGDASRWQPDCVATVRRSGGDAVLAEYRCEVKAGDAGLERSQRAAMGRVADDVTVLVVRVSLADLPDRYAATVEEIAGRGDSAPSGGRRTRLDEF